MPTSEEELAWLRGEGNDIVISLTEYPVPRRWIDQHGLMNVHIPIPDMSVPNPEDIEKALGTIKKARESKMGVLVHCLAGKGRTGTMLALHLVSQGMNGSQAIERIRTLRPGSIETDEQQDLVLQYHKDFSRSTDPK